MNALAEGAAPGIRILDLGESNPAATLPWARKRFFHAFRRGILSRFVKAISCRVARILDVYAIYLNHL